MRLALLIGAALVAASTALYAQAPQADDKAARRQQLKDAHEKARKACEGKQGDERRDCMRREMCAQAKDPAKCEAHAKEAMAQREKVREACKDRKGDELKACIREQHGRK
jgi:hypothetical protein